LALALAERDDLDLVVLTDQPSVFQGIETVRLKGPRPLADHWGVPGILRRLKPDVYHNTKNALPLRTPVPAVVTLHDLAYHHFPETFGPFSRLYLKWHHEHAANRADRVIAVSEHAKRDMIEVLGLSADGIDVIHHGVAPAFREPAGEAPDLPAPYVLSVGTIQARKNLDVLVQAVARVRERRSEPVTLAIAGRRGWKTEAFDAACRTTPVSMLGLVKDEALPALYAHAALFVQPSSYEGFGLTAVEAMACGAPVVAADAGSLPEVVDRAGLLVAPRDVEALADAIERILDDPAQRDRLRQAGLERAGHFTWERSAADHMECYRKAASKR
jgi:glycosyltransferase involved in cell wall biosynthesis